MRTFAPLAAALLLATSFAAPAHAAWPTSPTVNVPVCTAAGYQLQPCVTSDSSGGAIVAWVDFRGGIPAPASGMYAQHLLVTGTVDPAWPVNGVQLWSGTGWLPKIVADGVGGAIVTWTDLAAVDRRILAQHVRADGTLDPAWPAGGVVLCAAPGLRNDDAIEVGWGYQLAASDGAGGLLVAWDDQRSGTWDIYAQRVLASGAIAPGWPTNGLALCTAAGDQFFPALMHDGAGGAIVCWEDRRGGANLRTYAQHVLGSGSVDPAWTANGNLVSDATGWRPSLVTDGSTGAIVAQRAEPYSIRAQHLRIDGTADPAWPIGGRKIPWRDSLLIGYSHGPVRLAPDGANGAFLAWLEIPAQSGGWYNVGEAAIDASGNLTASLTVGAIAFVNASLASVDGVSGDWSGIAIAPGGGGVLMLQSTYPPSALGPVNLEAWRFYRTGDDSPAWSANAPTSVTIAPGKQLNPDLVPDGFGGAIAVWQDNRADSSGGNFDIYAQRLSTAGQMVGVGDPPTLATSLALAAPAPNPASRATTLRYALPAAARVSLRIYDAAGRLVRTLADTEQGAGAHAATWDLCDDAGRIASPGLYFARLEAGGHSAVRRIVLERWED